MQQMTRYGSDRAMSTFVTVNEDMPTVTAFHVLLPISNTRVTGTGGDAFGSNVTTGCGWFFQHPCSGGLFGEFCTTHVL